MPIPTTDQMTLPVLQHIADGQEYRRSDIINMIKEHFSLTEDERRHLSDGVTMERPLEHRGLIERPRTGYYRITPLGLEFLNSEEDNQEPEGAIDENYQRIREGLAAELLEKIKNNTPVFFEELVIDLLVAMGYGGSREDAETVGRSGDGGIDGIISEDRLGLDVVYIQAKRWEGSVGRPDIQRFAGALQGQRARKGVFITTSNFTRDAKEYVDTIDSKIVLIDGKQLAEYMIDHDIGVSVEKTYEIKRVDSDYFAENSENS